MHINILDQDDGPGHTMMPTPQDPEAINKWSMLKRLVDLNFEISSGPLQMITTSNRIYAKYFLQYKMLV